MKKIFTLLFAIGTITIASAQSKNAGHFNQGSTYADNNKHGRSQQVDQHYGFGKGAVETGRYVDGFGKSDHLRRFEKRRELVQLRKYHFENSRRMHENNLHRW